MQKKIISATLVIVGFVLGATALSALANWTAPSTGCTPPSCNTSTPLNASSSAQVKDGPLTLNFLNPTVDNIGLRVLGKIKMVDGNQADGKVLTSDADGVGTWQDPVTGSLPLAYTVLPSTCQTLDLENYCYDKDGCNFMIISNGTPNATGQIISDNAFSDTSANSSSVAWYARYPNMWNTTFTTGNGSDTNIDYSGLAFQLNTLQNYQGQYPEIICTGSPQKYRLFFKSVPGYTNKVIIWD